MGIEDSSSITEDKLYETTYAQQIKPPGPFVQSLEHREDKRRSVYVGALHIKMACQYLERYWKSGQRKLLEPLYQQAAAVITESVPAIND